MKVSEKKKDFFHLLIIPQIPTTAQGCTRMKPDPRSCILVSCVSQTQEFEHLTASHHALAEGWLRSRGPQNLDHHSDMGCWHVTN